jgi:diguanylate cyclase (GGDEF)-like protein
VGWWSAVSAWQWALLVGIVVVIPLSFFGWRRSQTELSHAANTDGLTGLDNRRRLSLALDEATSAASPDRPLMLAMYDLDGFKLYNDTYGHPAGDALLVRLAQRLSDCLGARGRAYRMGGDEFCVIAELATADEALDVASEAATALHEHGDGFTVSASYGAVLLPLETSDATEALRFADQRMYAQKSSSRMSAPRQTTDVLVRMMGEQNAELGDHVSVVVQLAAAVSERLGLPREQVVEVKRAAALHDIGKLAIPQSILLKPGPLSAAEWEFIRQHTVIGERILAAAPSLSTCATIVRASHERWDGNGYPDGLSGSDIPLAARIIAVCDAFEAMTSTRPYRRPMSVEGALAEVQRCAGTQFDADVVRAFVAEFARLQPADAALGLL